MEKPNSRHEPLEMYKFLLKQGCVKDDPAYVTPNHEFVAACLLTKW